MIFFLKLFLFGSIIKEERKQGRRRDELENVFADSIVDDCRRVNLIQFKMRTVAL